MNHFSPSTNFKYTIYPVINAQEIRDLRPNLGEIFIEVTGFSLWHHLERDKTNDNDANIEK